MYSARKFNVHIPSSKGSFKIQNAQNVITKGVKSFHTSKPQYDWANRMRAIEALKHKKPVARGHIGKKPLEEFGIDVFGEKEMKEKLPAATFDAFAKSNSEGHPLDPNVADQIATAMKEWAMHKGATHFTHWFQPLNGLTAEKHDSFVSFAGPTYNRRVMMNFSGKQLIKGEPDASSFPSGGLRSTFEARGYTVWDMSSPAFLRRGANGNFLCVPTAFCSWGGHALDFKTPLLKSENVLSKSVARLMSVLGEKDVKGAISEDGVEQEFFLIDRDFYFSRPDLVACGRTLQGAKPPKGQELEDHYFGNLDKRVLAFLQDAEYTLWRLGIPMNTRHNEVAPAQYEMAPIFENLPVACDHNMLMMEILREVAKDHEFACLLHEKPFAGVNGSGKHNNYSVSTVTHSGAPGKNLTDPGNSPEDNAKFMLMVSALVRALFLHGDVLRVGVATTGNDHRLGANEAPPAIISIFLGDQLDKVVDDIINMDGSSMNNSSFGSNSRMVLGVNSLPSLPRDASDRNRTSSFAFTGNKFEFRAVGSSQSCAKPMLMLNTIVSDSVNYVTDLLVQEMQSGTSKPVAIQKVVSKVLKEYKGSIFNGNGYSDEWKQEAVRRKLFNLPSSPEAFRELGSDKNKKLFASQGILSDVELASHQHVLYEQYVKALNVEANSLADLATTYIIPTALEYKSRLFNFASSDDSGIQKGLFGRTNTLANDLITGVEAMRKAVHHAETMNEHQLHEKASFYYQEILMGHMKKVRAICDELENSIDNKLWPLPKYSEMLFMK